MKVYVLLKLYRKFFFYILPTSGARTKWIYRHHNLFHSVGQDLFFQPRKLPDDTELIAFGDNVKISSGVTFVTHDIIHYMLNKSSKQKFNPYFGPIQIGNNVMIGANTMVMPNINICDNVIIAAGSIITKNITQPGVYGGIPAKFLKSFEDFVEKRSKISICDYQTLWEKFEQNN